MAGMGLSFAFYLQNNPVKFVRLNDNSWPNFMFCFPVLFYHPIHGTITLHLLAELKNNPIYSLEIVWKDRMMEEQKFIVNRKKVWARCYLVHKVALLSLLTSAD